MSGLARSITARATRGARAAARKGRRRGIERCEHGLLQGTCAICLQMEETIDLQSGRLAPEERVGPRSDADDEDEEEEE